MAAPLGEGIGPLIVRFVSLFAGIGGIDLGLERAGWRCVAQVELDDYCRAVLEKHWPDVPRFGDIRDVSVRDLPPTDALVGGFPCQPVSCAGSRKGHEDERWLWPEFHRLVREVRPAWVVAENVPGLRTLGADGVIQDLEACGYAVWPVVVGADDVGAPHRRKRVFVVAYRDSERAGGVDGLVGDAAAKGTGEGSKREWLRPSSGYGSETLAHRDEPGLEGRDGGELRGGAGELAPRPVRPHRWPSRPGEPQYEWEPPRLAYGGGRHRQRRSARFGRGISGEREVEGDGVSGDGNGRSESRLGQLPDGLPRGLAPRDRRARLKALGNAVVPAVAEVVGRAILCVASEPEKGKETP